MFQSQNHYVSTSILPTKIKKEASIQKKNRRRVCIGCGKVVGIIYSKQGWIVGLELRRLRENSGTRGEKVGGKQQDAS